MPYVHQYKTLVEVSCLRCRQRNIILIDIVLTVNAVPNSLWYDLGSTCFFVTVQNEHTSTAVEITEMSLTNSLIN